jgi:hypothetical protein
MEIFRKQELEQNITVQCTLRQENVQTISFGVFVTFLHTVLIVK